MSQAEVKVRVRIFMKETHPFLSLEEILSLSIEDLRFARQEGMVLLSIRGFLDSGDSPVALP